MSQCEFLRHLCFVDRATCNNSAHWSTIAMTSLVLNAIAIIATSLIMIYAKKRCK